MDPNPSRLTPTDAESRDLIHGAFAADGVDLTQISWFLGLTPGQRLAAAQDFLDGLMEPRDGREPDDCLYSGGFTIARQSLR